MSGTGTRTVAEEIAELSERLERLQRRFAELKDLARARGKIGQEVRS